MLDPDVVFRSTPASRRRPRRSIGAAAVARRVLARGAPLAPLARPAIVNGAAGAVVGPPGRPFAVVGFTVAGGRIVEIDLITIPAKLPGAV